MSPYGGYNSSPYASPLMGFDADLRNLYSQQYYNSFNAGGSNFFNSGLLSPPPQPAVSSPSTLMNFNSLSRTFLGNQSAASVFNPKSPYMPSTSATTSKNTYPFSTSALSMYGGLGYGTTAENMLSYLQSSYLQNANPTTSRTSNTPSPLSAQQVQGPNAKRNPMLSKELAIPSLMPPRNSHYEALNLQTPLLAGTSTTMATNTMPSSAIIQSSAIRARRKSCGAALRSERGPISEPHLTVKNVNSINKLMNNPMMANSSHPYYASMGISKDDSVLRSLGRTASNIGIVYPDKVSDLREMALSAHPLSNMGISYPTNNTDTSTAIVRNKKGVSSATIEPSTSPITKSNSNEYEWLLETFLTNNEHFFIFQGAPRISPTNLTMPSSAMKDASSSSAVISIIPEGARRTPNSTASSPAAVNHLVNNSSITITQTNKRPVPITTAKPQMVNNNVTISPIHNPSSTAPLTKTIHHATTAPTSKINSIPILRPVTQAPSSNLQINKSNMTVTATKTGPQMSSMAVIKPTPGPSSAINKSGNAIVRPSNQIQIGKVATLSPLAVKSIANSVPKTNAQPRNVFVNTQLNRNGSPVFTTKAVGNTAIRPVIVGRNTSQSSTPPGLARLSPASQASSPVPKVNATPIRGRPPAPVIMNRGRAVDTTPSLANRPGVQLTPVADNTPPVTRKRQAAAIPPNNRAAGNLNGVSITQVKRAKFGNNPAVAAPKPVRLSTRQKISTE